MDLGFGNKLSKSILRIHACAYSNHAIAEIIFHVSDENVIIKHTFTINANIQTKNIQTTLFAEKYYQYVVAIET
jgi:hypothetical protein